MDAFEKMIMDKERQVCPKCRGFMTHEENGTYKCVMCGYEMLDDFGKVKAFLEENGPTPIVIIQEKTGVSRKTIENFLKQGRVEIPEGSDTYIKCEKCGCAIRYGRYCPSCIKETADGIHGVFVAEAGEKPKEIKPTDTGARMRYLDKKYKK